MPRYSNNTELQNCGTAITPACLRALYNIPQASGSDDQNALGVYENQNDIYSQDDLNKFFAKYAPQVPQGTHPSYNGVDGAPQPVQSGSPLVTGESNVDFSIAYSLIYPQSVVLYQVEEEPPNGSATEVENQYTGFVNILDAVDGSFCTDSDKSSGFDCGTIGLTKVVSLSYSSPELEWTNAAADRTCNEFMKLSLQGTTFVFASGDYGVASNPGSGSTGNGCVDRSNINSTTTTDGTVFNPQFPNTCPYVLSVGATMLTSNQTVDDPESVMNIPEIQMGSATFSSAGGFANYAPLPDYQKDAVSSYLNNYAPDYPYYTYTGPSSITGSNGVYNRAGRGIPDVSANGANFMTFVDGQESPMDGTSLAAPIWASMLTLINEERTKQGKGSVGFVNSVLYENTKIFHDITEGNNPGCGTDGFPAAPGWDPATGLGTPDYPALLDVFLNLP
jgi:tripeptidyl-peptidase-1